MNLTILCVGLDAPHVGASDLTLALSPRDLLTTPVTGRRIVILGERALLELDAVAVRRRFRGQLVRVVGCVESFPPESLLPWFRAGIDEFVPPGQLPSMLATAIGCAVRPMLDVEDWCSRLPPPGSPVEKALEAVPKLDRLHSVREWAETLGWSRQKLWSRCSHDLGAPPGEVLFWYVASASAHALAHGLSVDDVAPMLGYEHASSLRHAFSRRGLSARAIRHESVASSS